MLCKIADLLVEVPDTGDMKDRCRDYLTDIKGQPDVVIDPSTYQPGDYPGVNENGVSYMESCRCFYWQLPPLDGMMLHASAVEYQGRAYLFSGPSTVGKSTHTHLWQQLFGEDVLVINDDKPALRCLDGIWYAYGTPWCGKDGINLNRSAPIAGICFLKQGHENTIRRLLPKEAVVQILSQSAKLIPDPAVMAQQLSLIDKLVRQIPSYELTNTAEPAAAYLSYKTMSGTPEE